MAEGTEVEPARALVLDANIMIRGIFGTRVRALIERYANEVALFTPQSCVDEVREYIPPLCAKRGWDPAVAMETLDALLTGISLVLDSGNIFSFDVRDSHPSMGAGSV